MVYYMLQDYPQDSHIHSLCQIFVHLDMYLQKLNRLF